MPILGLSGKRGVGKTALADHLVKTCGFTKVSFAEELRRLCRLLLPFTEADLTNPKLKEQPWNGYDFSPREFMVRLGEFMRFHDENYWVKVVLDRMNANDKCYVIDDVRFPNEACIIKERNGKVVRIERFESQNPYGKNLDIPSEKALDDYSSFDYVVPECKNTSLYELHSNTKAILELFY